MYVNLSHSSIEAIAEALESVVKDYLDYSDYVNFKKLEKHEYPGDELEQLQAIRTDINQAVHNALTVNMPNSREYSLAFRIGLAKLATAHSAAVRSCFLQVSAA